MEADKQLFTYNYHFPFEKKFPSERVKKLVNDHYHILPFISLIMLIFIIIGKSIMKNRKAFVLKNSIFIWDISMALIHTLGFLRLAPNLLHSVQQGFYESLCYTGNNYKEPVTSFWIFAMFILKLLQHGDLIIMVLRKKPFIFIYLYHHTLTMLYSHLIYTESSSIFLWTSVIHCFVDSYLSYYYVFKILNVKIPSIFRTAFGCLETFQILLVLYLHCRAYLYLNNHSYCQTSLKVISFMSFTAITMIMILFTIPYTNYKLGLKKKSQ